ncbi:flagellar biosynthetic protein FliO [Hahella aquimaris]|uniref:flagellar biosynthetic protein FliO n=1 Tax=Hahella sp. HNIBRBA332 TaxID=3015983 RepID=UPI00273BC083|nr:flagellar biosynthetic protein FliO [Hahella sp. HNIBRBA332]WLQ15714.1 flagellar biosynthetic protein FliO [Hahella sp. HNIBRBA332]
MRRLIPAYYLSVAALISTVAIGATSGEAESPRVAPSLTQVETESAVAGEKPTPNTESSRVAQDNQGGIEAIPLNELPFKDKGGQPTHEFSGVYTLLLFILVLLALVLWGVRRFLAKKGAIPLQAGQIRYIETKRLNAKTQAYLVEVEGRKVLIVDNGQSVAMQTLSLPATSEENSEQGSD